MAEEFQLVPLNQLCLTISSGGTPSRREPRFWTNGTIPWIKTGELNDWKIQTIEERITEAGLNGSAAKLYAPGTILIAMYGDGRTITTMGIVDTPAATNQACCGIVANPHVCDRLYLFYALKHERHKLLNLVVAGAQRNLSVGTIRNFSLPIPSLETQRRIASILGAYDDLIEVNRRRIAVLEEMARGLFEEWFVRFRFPGNEQVPILDTKDGPLPEGWTIRALADLCSRITDGAHRSPASVEVGKPMASVRDMRDWGFDYSACRAIDDAEWGELVRGDCRPLVGDILIAKDGANLNKHTFLVWREEPVVLLSSIAIVRAANNVQREFLTATLRSPSTDAAIKRMKSGAAIPRIVLKDFKRLPIVWPTAEVREEFERLIQPLHHQCRLLVESNRCLAASRDLLLPRLISGQLPVEAAECKLEEAA